MLRVISSTAYIWTCGYILFFLILFSIPSVYFNLFNKVQIKPWDHQRRQQQRIQNINKNKEISQIKNVNASQDQRGTKLDEPIKSKLLVNIQYRMRALSLWYQCLHISTPGFLNEE